MIEGLKLTVQGSEVKALIGVKADTHKQKAAAYRKQVASMKDSGLTEGRAPGTSAQSPIDQLQNKVDEHEREEKAARFLAAHVDTAETYLLTEADLQRIGVLSARW